VAFQQRDGHLQNELYCIVYTCTWATMSHTQNINTIVTNTRCTEPQVCKYDRRCIRWRVSHNNVEVRQSPCGVAEGDQVKHLHSHKAWYRQKDLNVKCQDEHDCPCFDKGKCIPYCWAISKGVQGNNAVEDRNQQTAVIAPVPPCAIAIEQHLNAHRDPLSLYQGDTLSVHHGASGTCMTYAMSGRFQVAAAHITSCGAKPCSELTN
jgi:hypothetical protein